MHLHASFGTFCVQICRFFARQLSLNNQKVSEIETFSFDHSDLSIFSNILQRLTVPPIIDQFGRKRCQKKRKEMQYKLISVYSKISLVHEFLAVKNLKKRPNLTVTIDFLFQMLIDIYLQNFRLISLFLRHYCHCSKNRNFRSPSNVFLTNSLPFHIWTCTNLPIV